MSIPAGERIFLLEQGASGTEIVEQLGELGVTRPGWKWRLLMRLEPGVYRAGEYRLEAGMTPRDVLAKLSSGQVVQYRFTLVEGWTFKQLVEALAANPVLVHELDPADPDSLDSFVASLGMEHPEGWFLPETYQFTRGDSDRDILGRCTCCDGARTGRSVEFP